MIRMLEAVESVPEAALGAVTSPVGMVAAGALVFGTPRGRKWFRSLIVSAIAAVLVATDEARHLAGRLAVTGAGVAEKTDQTLGAWRQEAEGLVQEARRKAAESGESVAAPSPDPKIETP